MSKKVPPERDKPPSGNINSTTLDIILTKEFTQTKETNLNQTGSPIQMNSNIEKTTEKLKDILQGKSKLEKRETNGAHHSPLNMT